MLGNVVKLNHEVPHVRTLVQFVNHDKPYLVIREDKAKSDAKVFREAASMISGTERGKVVAEWLTDLANKYDRPENPQAVANPLDAPAPSTQV